MARIAGVNIPVNKRVEIGLTYIFGIGRSTAQEILAEAKIDPNTLVKDLTEDEVVKPARGGRAARGRGRPAPRALPGRQTADGDRLLPRPAPPSRPAGAGPADQDQRAWPQGPAPDERRRQAQGLTERARWQRKKPAKGRSRRRVKKNITYGQAHIKTSFNNTIVTLTDTEGNVIAWESAGSAGFKGSRKSTPFAAQVTADAAAKKGMEHGLEKVEVFAKGAGSGRETAIRSLQAAGLDVTTVKDVSPQAHNGCRPKKRRRV